MNYSLMTYDEINGKFNIGDYIQSLAARQFLPKTDFFVNRERLAQYSGAESKIILNGWFTHEPETWIPSKDLTPLFISFHINSSASERILSPKGLNYLKKHEPIGCRDHYTAQLLKQRGIRSYFSGCLTTTLSNYADSNNDGKVYIVDPLYGFPNRDRILSNPKSFLKATLKGDVFRTSAAKNAMEKIFDQDLLDNAEYIKHELPAKKFNEQEKFILADSLLKKYAKAQLVITSRIHCALPCLAMNTPVIYLNGFESKFDACRMEGLSELFNTININRKTGNISANFELNGLINEKTSISIKNDHVALAKKMITTTEDFIKST